VPGEGAPRVPGVGDVLLDWNESPIGPPESAIRRVIQAARNLHRYPRGALDEVTVLAAGYLGVRVAGVLLTAGVDEAADLALSLVQRGWGVQPGFDGYADRAQANGKPFEVIPLDGDWQPPADWQRALGWHHADDDAMAFLAQPNNPTGNLFSEDWVISVRHASRYVFVDETYPSYAPASADEAVTDPGLLVYRSFSKAMGLAGIRLGAVVADAETIDQLRPLRRFMPIDAVSLNAAAGVLEDTAFVEGLTTHVLQARPELVKILRDSASSATSRIRKRTS
jgi:histidinol-phosphate/aromatic aminotransferase/cobyric acid decarboxylase-like protein